MENNNAIILAMFGTSVEDALPGLLHIRNGMIDEFPGTTVRIAFTSKILRRIWHQRADDPHYRAANPGISDQVFNVRKPLDVVNDLMDAGSCAIVVQPVYMAPAEEYQELLAAVVSFKQDNPTFSLAVGRPALGEAGAGQAGDEIVAAAQALACDAGYARERKAALMYMGHGSKRFSTAPLYREFAAAMVRLYPDVPTFVATVEGSLGMEKILPQLRQRGVDKIVLKPFMVVAGDHVRRDMIGPEPRGWKTRLEKEGFTVEAVLRGLGEQDGFVGIFVRHAGDAVARLGMEHSNEREC